VEGHGAKTNYYIPQVDQDEDGRVRILNDIAQALDTKPHKDEIGEGIDHLGAVERDVVILEHSIGL
jgi:hypothetical protein